MGEFASHAVDYAADSLAGIFEPDVVLPSQFFDVGTDGLHGGERKLMAALLSDGVESYISQAVKGFRDKDEVRDWIHTKDYSYVFSFDVVCQCLGIDADYLRSGLQRYLETAESRSVRNSDGSVKKIWKKIRRPRK